MLARGIRIVLQIIEIPERINLLNQAVLAGEILNVGQWGSFLGLKMKIIVVAARYRGGWRLSL